MDLLDIIKYTIYACKESFITSKVQSEIDDNSKGHQQNRQALRTCSCVLRIFSYSQVAVRKPLGSCQVAVRQQLGSSQVAVRQQLASSQQAVSKQLASFFQLDHRQTNKQLFDCQSCYPQLMTFQQNVFTFFCTYLMRS